MPPKFLLLREISIHVALPLLTSILIFCLPLEYIPNFSLQSFLPQGLLAYCLASIVRLSWKNHVPNSWWLGLMGILLLWGASHIFLFSNSASVELNELFTCLIFATPVYFQQLNNLDKTSKTT